MNHGDDDKGLDKGQILQEQESMRVLVGEEWEVGNERMVDSLVFVSSGL